MADTSRSRSRGRELYSTGRGGAGNIHRSHSRDGSGGPPVSPAPRGRESTPSREPVTHTGRGGAGNFHDPSQPREQGISPAEASYEHDVIERHEDSPHFLSTGRGGAGNIKSPTPEASRSRSRGPSSSLDHQTKLQTQAPDLERSQSRGRVLHSTGRGGAGNITADTLYEEDADELERRAYSPSRVHPSEMHSTGRGGLANVTALGSPPVEASPSRLGAEDGNGGVFSTGRGGVGNIASRDHTRSASRGRGEHDGHEAAAQHHSALGKLMDRVKGLHHEHQDHGHQGHGEAHYEKEGREVPEAGVEGGHAALK